MKLFQNIILIGFMACGKTTIGQKLAQRLNYSFIDTDSLIEKSTGKKIINIFKDEGEQSFRDLETKEAFALKNKDKNVISTGGGIILRSENISALKEAGQVVFLNVNPETVLRRVKDHTTRPLINYDDPHKRLETVIKIMNERREKYEAAADIIIDANDDNIDRNVQNILEQLKR